MFTLPKRDISAAKAIGASDPNWALRYNNPFKITKHPRDIFFLGHILTTRVPVLYKKKTKRQKRQKRFQTFLNHHTFLISQPTFLKSG
jgi:hypothetical protein